MKKNFTFFTLLRYSLSGSSWAIFIKWPSNINRKSIVDARALTHAQIQRGRKEYVRKSNAGNSSQDDSIVVKCNSLVPLSKFEKKFRDFIVKFDFLRILIDSDRTFELWTHTINIALYIIEKLSSHYCKKVTNY